jgi:hypothetical protein
MSCESRQEQAARSQLEQLGWDCVAVRVSWWVRAERGYTRMADSSWTALLGRAQRREQKKPDPVKAVL